MEPVRSSSSRGTRLTLVAVALFALLAIVAFASRSGFGGSSDARPSDAYVNWAFSIFLVLFVFMIPVAIYAYVVQGHEAHVERARGFKKSAIQNVLMFGLFLGIAVLLIYIKRFRPDLFGRRDQSPLRESNVELPPTDRTALRIIQDLLVAKTTPSAAPTPF